MRRWNPRYGEEALRDLLRAEVAAALGHPDPTAVPVDAPFPELGADSLTVTHLRGRLATATGLRLAPTALFDHPTIHQLADHLHTRLTP